ncbi:MAG: hypothetical protein INQ03_23045 [Candidatus Heimdallarchaeota archaeon]|nr:hypothetical protein [Candidatus Heimdallarchaeota archaeon]
MNPSIEFIVIFIVSLITLGCSLGYYRQYRKSPDLLIGSMALAWFFYALTQFSIAIGVLLLNPFIYALNPVFFGLCAFTAQISFDLIERGKVSFWHIGGISLLIGALMISSIFLDEVIHITLANGSESLLVTGITRNLVMLLALFVVTQNFIYAVKIYRNVQTEDKLLRRNILIGNFLFGPGAFIAYTIQPLVLIPGSIDLLIAIGLLISTYSILKAPQLLFTLPFKAIQLSLIEQDSGISLYSYTWSKSLKLVDDQLLSAVLEAITVFVSESMHLGEINEIGLKDGKIIIMQLSGTNKYLALIATEITLSLRIGLEKFSSALFVKYGEQLAVNHVLDVSEFQDLSDLIMESFPYTPNHL